MSESVPPVVEAPAPAPKKSNRKRTLVVLAILLIVLVVVLTQIGFYTVQPIGALPDGVTLLVRRLPDEPFFNSPDAMCLKIMGSVSLLCRAEAMSLAPIDRIIVRLPYMEWAYTASTGGRQFDR